MYTISNLLNKQKLNYPKSPICSAGTYLHHDYEYYSRFKGSSKKGNRIHVTLKKSIFYEPLAQEINFKFNFKHLRTNINIIIDALYMYFSGSSSTKDLSQYLLHRKIF